MESEGLMKMKPWKAALAGVALICATALAYVPVASVVKGGTGRSTLTLGSILVGNGVGAITMPSNLTWDNTNFRLGIGATPPLLEKFSVNSLYLRKSDGTQAYPLITSPAPSTNGLFVVRGVINSSNVTVSGEGFSSSNPSTGNFTVTYTTAFADVPSVVITPIQISSASRVNITSNAAGSFQVQFIEGNTASTLINNGFNFQAIGQRPN